MKNSNLDPLQVLENCPFFEVVDHLFKGYEKSGWPSDEIRQQACEIVSRKFFEALEATDREEYYPAVELYYIYPNPPWLTDEVKEKSKTLLSDIFLNALEYTYSIELASNLYVRYNNEADCLTDEAREEAKKILSDRLLEAILIDELRYFQSNLESALSFKKYGWFTDKLLKTLEELSQGNRPKSSKIFYQHLGISNFELYQILPKRGPKSTKYNLDESLKIIDDKLAQLNNPELEATFKESLTELIANIPEGQTTTTKLRETKTTFRKILLATHPDRTSNGLEEAQKKLMHELVSEVTQLGTRIFGD